MLVCRFRVTSLLLTHFLSDTAEPGASSQIPRINIPESEGYFLFANIQFHFASKPWRADTIQTIKKESLK
jgi:hypothetical protein